MNQKEIEFEKRLDYLALLKALLVARGEFRNREAEEYEQIWNEAFKLLE